MANKFKKTGYTLKCSNPECNNMIYVKKSTYENNPIKLFTCCRECKNHPFVVKTRQDKMKENGYINPFKKNEIKEKIKNTNLEKYGVENPFSSEIVKEKIKNTNIEKYGCTSPMQNKDIQLKAHLSRIEKYGIENLQGVVPIDKSEATCMKKYGSKNFFSSDAGKMTRDNLIKNHGYTGEEVDNIFKSKSITLTSMIERWGDELGKLKYDKWLKETRQSKENFIKRWGEEKGIKLWETHILKIYNNNCLSGSISKISLELFDKINSYIGTNEYCFYGNKEWFISKKDNIIYFYDFRYKNKIIEFNGDYWHGNPLFYKNDDYLNMPNGNKVLVEHKWKSDKEKINTALENGFEVKIVWENDYRKDKDLILKECLEFLGLNNV